MNFVFKTLQNTADIFLNEVKTNTIFFLEITCFTYLKGLKYNVYVLFYIRHAHETF